MKVDGSRLRSCGTSLLQPAPGFPIKALQADGGHEHWFRSEDDSQPLRWITLSRAGLSLTFQKGILDECLTRTVKLQLHDVSRRPQKVMLC